MARRTRPCDIHFAALAALSIGCAPPPCTSSVACGRGRVCGLDGVCGPLAAISARFAASEWLPARDWGTSGTGVPLSDALRIGGRAEGLLAFGPLPGGRRIMRAILVLSPHETQERVDTPGELIVEHVEPFRGGALPPRAHPGPLTFAAARHALSPGPARTTRIDVTGAARAAAGRRDRSLYLLVRREGEGNALFASPWALGDRAPPRLELLLN